MRTEFTAGFTLVELLVTLSVASIILTLAVPGFQAMIRENRMAANSSQLLTALNLARSEAIKRGLQVTLCKANAVVTPPSCDDTACNAGTGSGCWEKGWLLFADRNGNGILNDGTDPDFCAGGDCTIRLYEPLPAQLTLRTGANLARWVAYRSPGTGLGSGGLATGTFRLCQGTDTAHARSVVLNSIGRARVAKGAPACP